MADRRSTLAVALCAALSACNLGPYYQKPAIAAPTAWTPAPEAAPADKTDAASAPLASTPTPQWPSSDWWHGFGSADLDALMAQAQQSNDDLAAAVARVREANAQVQIAGAALFPTVDLGATATRAREHVTNTGVTSNAATGSSNTAIVSSYAPLLSASYELDFWGKNRALRRAAQATADANNFDRAVVQLSVMSSVATTYFQVLELRDRIKVAEDHLTSAHNILHGLERQQAVGIATALDVAQQATTVATLDAAVPPLRQQLQQSLDALAVLLGQMPQNLTVNDSTLTALALPQVAPGLPSELLARRPDVAEAEAQLISANANIAAARAAFLPTISLTGDAGFESNALTNLLKPANRVFSVSAGLTQPIFEGGALSGQYHYSKARYAELLANYHKAAISAFGNVEDALVTLQQTEQQQALQEVASAKAKRAYTIAQAQQHAGTIDILTVLNTETALFTADDALIQVRFAHLQALVGLFNALGGGWSDTGVAP